MFQAFCTQADKRADQVRSLQANRWVFGEIWKIRTRNRGVGDASSQAGHVEERLGQSREEPETGDRHRPQRSQKEGREGAAQIGAQGIGAQEVGAAPKEALMPNTREGKAPPDACEAIGARRVRAAHAGDRATVSGPVLVKLDIRHQLVVRHRSIGVLEVESREVQAFIRGRDLGRDRLRGSDAKRAIRTGLPLEMASGDWRPAAFAANLVHQHRVVRPEFLPRLAVGCRHVSR